ncbi:membrane protein [Pararhizobium polonicum]|uniref:Membrane protein n=1 Tax=Pararhizobium polonicum TaxID=1612624 RepID=A0A1C7NTE8_9HYPH|nr:anthrone oxygenase family protein [Pararhizobium polonicum]OBZ92272.1 membrane protein [Pararhizobium polonicum]
MATLFPLLIFSAALGAGINAGLFFIFSVCIMGALGRLPAEQGIAAMQAINVVILNPLFLLVFMGTAVLSLVLVAGGFVYGGPARLYLIAGGLLFLAGTMLVTMVFNVPMNNALEALQPGSEEATRLWSSTYLVDWVRWNHLRTLSSIGALGCFIMAFRAA